MSYVNDPRVIAQQDRFVSINSTLEIDLTGQCNSEFLNGYQYSGAGGQVDFVRGAYASRGGKSFMVLSSTAADGAVSRIVPRLQGPVTTSRMDVHWVVTEHGAVCLKGKSEAERAEALISIAAPQFRDQLQIRGGAGALSVAAGRCEPSHEWRRFRCRQPKRSRASQTETFVLVEVRGNVGLITLNRPQGVQRACATR